MNLEIYVATHKAYNFPENNCYVPIHVGKQNSKLNLGLIGDDTGNHISDMNESFCELTALYWIWKNSNADILGLVHYRRYFINTHKQLLTSIEINNLKENQIIVAEQEQFFSTRKILGLRILKRKISVLNHYAKDHCKNDLLTLRKIILNHSPDYLTAFDMVCERKQGISLYNMFIMHRAIVDEYCHWLFSILFLLQKEVNIADYNSYQKRIFGFLAERMFNVFLFKNKNRLEVIYTRIGVY